ncbi:MAG: hypothetical protein UGF45_08170 [Massilioclostridium sp.]|nr:hypothetical protein [Massilioclostridium sp.]
MPQQLDLADHTVEPSSLRDYLHRKTDDMHKLCSADLMLTPGCGAVLRTKTDSAATWISLRFAYIKTAKQTAQDIYRSIEQRAEPRRVSRIALGAAACAQANKDA